MNVEYIYCNSCGYEDLDVGVAYSRQTANGSYWFCPECNNETSHVDTGEEKYENFTGL